ncbi:MAG TPA: hypothetical protein PLV05_14265 [Verrucomicrobiota bacterium]|jgi:hypothetical protein|nr:hypothetical protein [Sedimentisphaerales bacterium]HPC54239.1 hypothetical protein [Verrucomicrobiota bacterium]HRR65839.1 hypothetical protein [Candidatus Paceibacterota bacterium]HQE89082.1 hypothetical protein [Verrucomicrobiota bacterium]HQH01642.1 hypothetical protein [Verrucomicrobiota bacterium]
MKAIKHIIGRLLTGCMVVFGLVINLGAQNKPIDKPPIPGTYYLAKDFGFGPPYPFNPHPELETVEVEPGVFVIDDTLIPDTPEQAAARAAHQAAVEQAKAIASDPILAEAARQAAEEAVRKREQAWQERLQAVQPFLRSWGWPGDAETHQRREEAKAELAELKRKAEAARANAPQDEAALDEIASRLNVERVRVRTDGGKEALAAQSATSLFIIRARTYLLVQASAPTSCGRPTPPLGRMPRQDGI